MFPLNTTAGKSSCFCVNRIEIALLYTPKAELVTYIERGLVTWQIFTLFGGVDVAVRRCGVFLLVALWPYSQAAPQCGGHIRIHIRPEHVDALTGCLQGYLSMMWMSVDLWCGLPSAAAWTAPTPVGCLPRTGCCCPCPHT